jgi:hypothetical protein
LQRHDNLYSGQWISVTANGATLELTANHPIWVLEGAYLAERPAPAHLDVRGDEGKALRGRWLNSQDLREGDVLLSRISARAVVQRVHVSQRMHAPVCNLTVRQYHTFLVGPHELLAHNDSWCEILERKFGWQKPQKLREMIEQGIRNADGSLKTMSAIHGHHIVMKDATDEFSVAARRILEEYDIPLLRTQDELRKASADQLHNLSMAIHGYRGLHSREYAQAVWKRLFDAVEEGKRKGYSKAEVRESLQEALGRMREILERGEIFWAGY